jgi:hypothetical protein
MRIILIATILLTLSACHDPLGDTFRSDNQVTGRF